VFLGLIIIIGLGFLVDIKSTLKGETRYMVSNLLTSTFYLQVLA